MGLETLFSICGALAGIGWVGLVLLPRMALVTRWLAPVIVPIGLALVYVTLFVGHWGDAPEGGGFGSLAAVTALFSVPGLLLAGWIHYLAFDLFVGAWEVRDAQREGVPHLVVIPSLVATFLAGPAGLLLYWLTKLAYRFARPKGKEEASA